MYFSNSQGYFVLCTRKAPYPVANESSSDPVSALVNRKPGDIERRRVERARGHLDRRHLRHVLGAVNGHGIRDGTVANSVASLNTHFELGVEELALDLHNLHAYVAMLAQLQRLELRVGPLALPVHLVENIRSILILLLQRLKCVKIHETISNMS
jgi:hypothetical protein